MHKSIYLMVSSLIMVAATACSSNGAGGSAGGDSSDGPGGGGTDTTAPAAVSNLTVVATSATQARVTWTDPADEDLATIVLTPSTSDGEGPSTEVSPGAGNAVVTGLRPDMTNTITVVARDGAGNTSPGSTVDTTTTALFAVGDGFEISSIADAGFTALHAADLDGDDYADVVVAGSNDSVVWFKNTNGSFASGQTIASGATDADDVRSLHTADLDGDDKIDVLAATRLGSLWYQNDGSGSSWPVNDLDPSSTAGATSVHAVDLDNDGDIDVVSDSNGFIEWYKNRDDAVGFEAPQRVYGFQVRPNALYATDVSGDARADIVSVSSTGSVAWYRNNGDGTFQRFGIVNGSTGPVDPEAVYATDLDGDGDADIVVPADTDDTVKWYRNTNGTGSFSLAADLTPAADGAVDVYAIDLDGDGDTDILSGSSSDGRVVWYENDGSGSFAAGTDITTTARGVNSIYAIDLDGDGDVDVLSATNLFLGPNQSGRLAWYENLSVLP